MKLARLNISILFAFSVFPQTPANPKAPASTTKQTQLPPTKTLFIADYIAHDPGHSDGYGNPDGSMKPVGRNMSLEAIDGFTKHCPAVTVTDHKEAADYILRPNKGSSMLYTKNGEVAYVSHAKVKVSNLVKDVCSYIQAQL